MRSTRSLLILYFLVLTGLSLGVIGILADRVSSQALTEKEEAAAKAIRVHTEERIRAEREKLNLDLLHDARMIARTAQSEYLTHAGIERDRFPLFTMYLPLLGGMGPREGGWAALWFATVNQPSRRGGLNSAVTALTRGYFENLQLDQLFLKQLDDEDRINEYLQMNSSLGSVRRSKNLQERGYVLPFERKKFDAALEDWVYDDVNLPDGQMGRRVILKTPVPYTVPNFPRFFPQQPRGRWPGPDPRRPGATPEPPPAFEPPPMPLIYIHVARPYQELSAKIASLREDARQDYEVLTNSTITAKRSIRLALGTAGFLTFLASLVGSSWLIHRGLKPLNALSDAVSQVSERDFHLSVERHTLTTELQPIHERITETLEQLKLAFEREKQAVADISHELRTPVAALLATIDVSLRKPRTNEQYLDTLKDCRGITKQLGQLVEKVMTLAYLDAGQATMSSIGIDVATVASSCAAVIRPLADAQGLTFELRNCDPTEVTTDPDKLREILTNLLHNAVEYNRPGGHIELSVNATDTRLQFQVRDSGIGMSPEVRDRIFERFYRADASRTATGVHAGLGLAIVKEYAQRLGGNIRVESEPGIGTNFVLTLPRD